MKTSMIILLTILFGILGTYGFAEEEEATDTIHLHFFDTGNQTATEFVMLGKSIGIITLPRTTAHDVSISADMDQDSLITLEGEFEIIRVVPIYAYEQSIVTDIAFAVLFRTDDGRVYWVNVRTDYHFNLVSIYEFLMKKIRDHVDITLENITPHYSIISDPFAYEPHQNETYMGNFQTLEEFQLFTCDLGDDLSTFYQYPQFEKIYTTW